MLGWLAEVAQSLVAMLPVAGAVVVLIAAALAFYGQFAVFSTVTFAVVSYLSFGVSSLTQKLSSLGANRPFLVTLFSVTSLGNLIDILISVVGVVIAVVGVFLTVFEAIGAVLLAIYVYQKVKLFANMLAVKGANE